MFLALSRKSQFLAESSEQPATVLPPIVQNSGHPRLHSRILQASDLDRAPPPQAIPVFKPVKGSDASPRQDVGPTKISERDPGPTKTLGSPESLLKSPASTPVKITPFMLRAARTQKPVAEPPHHHQVQYITSRKKLVSSHVARALSCAGNSCFPFVAVASRLMHDNFRQSFKIETLMCVCMCVKVENNVYRIYMRRRRPSGDVYHAYMHTHTFMRTHTAAHFMCVHMHDQSYCMQWYI
jgi:hypothetical protein